MNIMTDFFHAKRGKGGGGAVIHLVESVPPFIDWGSIVLHRRSGAVVAELVT